MDTRPVERLRRFDAFGWRGEHLQDVNLDGFTDLVLHFRTAVTGIGCDDDSATLTGTTLAGQSFEGRDSIAPAGCVGFPRVFEVEPRSARAGSVIGIQPR